MLVKNQIYEAEITDYTAEGQGVAHIEGCAVFIPNAVAGEKVRVRVEKAQKTWAAGKIVEISGKVPPTGSTGSVRSPSSAAAAISGTWTMPRRPG